MEITETLAVSNRAAWRTWLMQNQSRKREIWLLLDKNPQNGRLIYLDAVEEAICFGWIDGIGKRYDDHTNAQRFTPRRRRSHWTELNKQRARRLIRLKLMTPTGQAVLPDLTIHPVVADDIREALQAVPDAWENFQSFPDLYRRVRIGYIEEKRRDHDEFERRLRNFIAKTQAGKMYGNWNDAGRLDPPPHKNTL